MVLRKLIPSGKFFLFLLINLVFFGGIFVLKLFGLTTNALLPVLTIAAFLEIFYLTISIQTTAGKNAQSVEEVKEHIKNIRENEEKTQTALIYIGHQMKVMQHELNILRKNSLLKPSINGYRTRVHA